MRIIVSGVLCLIAVSWAIACGNPGGSTGQSQTSAALGALAVAAPSALQASSAASNSTERRVTMMDACDGPTFNEAVGPGTCSRPHGVAFPEFIAQLTAHQFAGAWHNAPSQTDAWIGDSILAVNNGGETHTFTRVAAYGGGIVPILNDLSGNSNVAPECNVATDFVPPGGTETDGLDKAGELKFQCCIHPWMRTTVTVKSH